MPETEFAEDHSEFSLRSIFFVIGRFPESLGVLRFLRELLTGQAAKLIEYK